MKLIHLNFTLIGLLAIIFFSACEKEEIQQREEPQYPEKPVGGRFDKTPFKWDYKLSSVSKDDIFIGDQYISVENRYMITPAPLYIGAVFGENDFAQSFKPEITAPRNPLDVIFDFTKPFTGTIDKESGSTGYKKLLAEALESRQYKEYIKNRLSPFDIKITEVYTNSDIEKAFPANNGVLGELLSKEVESKPKKAGIKSKLVGAITNRSFTTYMDTPVYGFFKDKKINESPQNPVYLRSITYGKAAFFVIESPYSYQEVEGAILSKLSLNDAIDKGVEVLKNSTITLFIISGSLQIAKVYNSFQDLDDFLKSPFNEYSYGYPIYCQGVFTKDNTLF